MAQWQQAPPVPQTMRTEDRLYTVSRCTRGPGGTACSNIVDVSPRHDAVDPNRYQYELSCPICTRVRSALFQHLEHTRDLDLAVGALQPDMPLLPVGECWNPAIARPQPFQQPIVRQKVKAYVARPGAAQAFRAFADADRQLPHPPPRRPPVAIGGAQAVEIASGSVPPARGVYTPANAAFLRDSLPPPSAPPVRATPPHAASGGKAPPPPPPPVGAMPLHAVPGGKTRDGRILPL